MQLIEFDADDPEIIDGMLAVLDAAHEADTPENPAPVHRFYRTMFTHLFPGREKRWIAAVKGGEVVGFAALNLWTKVNMHLVQLRGAVHPAHRRQGVGSALLDQVVAIARETGRDTITAGAALNWEGGPARTEAGARFLEKQGFSKALTTVNRRSRVDGLEAAELERLHAEALAASDGYEVRQWVGPDPEDLLASMARMDTMIVGEIPLGDLTVEVEEIDTENVRAKEAVHAAEGSIRVETVAVDRSSGQVVAWSEIDVVEGDHTAAHQLITIVDPAHRGHRLGLLCKLDNLRLLRERFPHVTEIWTDNADVNEHMIAINAALGYETFDAVGEYQRKLEA